MIFENPEEYPAVMRKMCNSTGNGGASDRHNVYMITKACAYTIENSVVRNLDAFDLLHIQPVVYEGGWKFYYIIAFRHQDLKRLLQRLEARGFTVEVLRKSAFDGFITSSFMLTADALLSDLTEKQVDALLTAYAYGYYRLPRHADAKTIAEKTRAPRTTFQEHLKKAENKLIMSIIPSVELFRQASTDKNRRSKIKNSALPKAS